MSPTLSRRSFLRLTALSAGALALPPFPAASRPLRSGRPKRIVVVGAGLAGLAAALELVDAGHDVTVLEAQLRPGGRVLTAREPFADGLYADLGAARIPLNHDRTLGYAERFGLPLVPFWPEARQEVLLFGGQRLEVVAGASPDLAAFGATEREVALGLDAIFEARWGEYRALVAGAGAPGWSPPEALRALDAESVAAYHRRHGWSPGLAAFLGLGFNDPEGAYGLSALWALLEEALLPGDARRLRIAGGMDLLPRAMAGALGGRIHYGRPVTRIDQSASGVRVHAEGYGGPRAFDAERVIVAAPFPPLRRVTFDPPLSAGKQRAIRELAYDSLSRVPLQVRRRPWEARGWSGFARTDLPSEVWHTTWDTPGERGILSIYVKERASLRLTAMDADDRLAYAAEHVEAVFPSARAEVEGGTAKCWSEDPWAGGAHAFPTPGQMFDLLPHVATVEGRIHFAGEHTSLWQAWMQGALESGERAAREVNDAP